MAAPSGNTSSRPTHNRCGRRARKRTPRLASIALILSGGGFRQRGVEHTAAGDEVVERCLKFAPLFGGDPLRRGSFCQAAPASVHAAHLVAALPQGGARSPAPRDHRLSPRQPDLRYRCRRCRPVRAIASPCRRARRFERTIGPVRAKSAARREWYSPRHKAGAAHRAAGRHHWGGNNAGRRRASAAGSARSGFPKTAARVAER